CAEINPGLAVRRKPHDLPLIAVRNEPEETGELRIKQAQRLRPIQRQDMIEASVVAMPDRRRFPRPATVHHYYRRVVKTGICIRADRVRQMMIHVTETRFVTTGTAYPENAAERPRS